MTVFAAVELQQWHAAGWVDGEVILAVLGQLGAQIDAFEFSGETGLVEGNAGRQAQAPGA